MTTIVSFVILLGILIFVHELGHFLAARMGGVGVLKFSLGFGPKIFGKKFGETEYVLSWIPLGGFVKLLGESDTEDLPPEDEKRSFLKQPVWKRLLIVLAGPAFNFLLAIVIFTGVLTYGLPSLTSEIGNVQAGSAAYESGILSGDKVISIDGQKIEYWEDIRSAISESRGRPVSVVVDRAGDVKEFVVQPRLSKTKNVFGEDVSAYLIGIAPSEKTAIERRTPLDAFLSSLVKTWEISKLTVVSVVKIFEGVISPRTIGGPIFIAQVAGAQVKEGIVPFVLFIAILSVNLGVINLFPIPVLDGGHILFYLYEIVFRREISAKVREMAQQIGFVILLMLMLFVIYVDLERLNLGFINQINKIFK